MFDMNPLGLGLYFVSRYRQTSLPPIDQGEIDISGGEIIDDGNFIDPPIVFFANDKLTFHGKKKRGGSGKFIYTLGRAQAGYMYTMRYDPDFTQLENGGVTAFVGFGLKQSNKFHLTGLKGDGGSGLHAFKIYGNNWKATTGFNTVDDGAAAAGTQAGPNWLRFIVSSDGLTYTLQTSANGTSWTDEFTSAVPTPHSDVVSLSEAGIAVFLDVNDAGPFTVFIELWEKAPFVGDPYWANVVYLASYEGTHGSTTYSEQKNGRTLSFAANSQIDNTHAEYGTTSLKSFNGSVVTIADNDDWDLSNANSDQFTIEFSTYNTDRASSYNYWNSLFGGGNYGWLIQFNAADIIFYWTSDGSTFQTLTAAGAVGSVNTWNKYCFQKDGSGKMSIHVNGVLKASSTPANSAFFNASGSPVITASGAGQTSWKDNERITKGVCRHPTSTNYTPDTGPFPVG